jgi:glycosyltransferase involved in cell wall biosynthesis
VRLGVFSGDRYWREDGVLSSDVSFVHFLAGLSELVDELVLFGRLDPRPGTAANVLSAPRLTFVPLPHYERLTDVRGVLRARVGSKRAFASLIRELDAVWIFGPHPFARDLVRRADRRGVPVFLGVRTDFPRYVHHRATWPAEAWQLPAAYLLDRAFLRLTKHRPTVVVGRDLARRYGGRDTLVSGFSLVRDHEVDSSEESRPGWGKTVRLLSVTRLEEEKNPLLLPEILARLREAGDWRLEVVGDGPLRGALEEKARELRLDGALEISGWVPFGPELRERYRRADAFLHVSLTEGLPQVLFEAGAARLPIVATDVGGVAEALGHGTRGIVVPPRDADAAVRALLSLADPARRLELVRAGLAHVRARTLDVQAAEIVRFFASCLPSHDIDPATRRLTTP